MVTHSSSLPGESPWTEEPGRLQVTGLQRIRPGWVTKRRAVVLLVHLAVPAYAVRLGSALDLHEEMQAGTVQDTPLFL